jgi:hypothetical protein
MRLTRILLLVVVAAAIAGVFASGAKAIAFNDSTCPPDPARPTIHWCPSGETGKSYSLQISARGGCDTYVWTNPGGNMPPGLTLGSGGLISGVPTTPGQYIFWLQIQDTFGNPSWCTDNNASQRQFEIDVLQGLQIAQRQSALTPGQLNTPYNLQLTAKGAGSSPLTWSVVAGSGSLPAGITLNSSTGLLSGTPTTNGDYRFQIKVTDGTRTDVQTYTMAVVDPLKITSPSAASGELGQALQTTLTASGGRQPYTWTLASGSTLPAGLTLDSATGAITGTPTAAGVSPVKVIVTDALGLTQPVDLRIVVAQELSLTKRSLPAAKVGRKYNARLLATGGVAPKTWRVFAGLLPRGLRLNAKTGVISGTPKRVGTAHVTINVTDQLGVVSKATFTLKVRA